MVKVCLIFLFCVLGSVTYAQERYALVIGNSNYDAAPSLPNPQNDASDIAEKFVSLGYLVDLYIDLDFAGMMRALRDFSNKSSGAEHAIIYYAGHGIEVDRNNYLIPTDAKIVSDIDITFETVPLDLLVRSASGADKLSLVIVDACRNNPFLKSMKRTNSSRSIGRGLALIEPPSNTLVAYAAKEGTVAEDGTGRNSPYATALLSALSNPRTEIGKLFRQVRDDVISQTSGRQEPFLYGSLSAEDIFLSTAGAPALGSAQNASVPEASGGTETDKAIDLAFWQAISGSADINDYQSYLSQFPGGSFRALAQRQVTKLSRSVSLSPEKPVAAEPVPSDPPDGFNATRSVILEVQERLNILSMDAGGEDGLIGPRTRRAVRKFQLSAGLPDSGAIDAATYQSLKSSVTEAKFATYRAKKAAAAKLSAPGTSSGRVVNFRANPSRWNGRWCNGFGKSQLSYTKSTMRAENGPAYAMTITAQDRFTVMSILPENYLVVDINTLKRLGVFGMTLRRC